MRQIILISFLTVLMQFSCYSQNRWIKQYHEELSAPGHYLATSYDRGYLITGWVAPNFPKYTWIIKTDINGEVLWEKFLGGQNNSTIIDCFKQNKNGEIYLSGGIVQEGNADPLIIKLNACGEKQWCKQFSTTSNNDFFWDIVITPDGGCAALIYGAYFPLYIKSSGILRFSPEGELLWQQYYQSSDQGVDNEELSNLILTPDSGFLMTGYCYYPDPDNPSLYWLHPYYVKTDSLGNFEWEIVLHGETGDMGGKAWATITDPTQKYYYSCISHYYTSDTLYTKRPAFVKIDLQGDVVGVYDLVNEDYDFGTLFSATFINDSLLASGASWFYSDDQPQSRAIIFDTLGNIKDSLTLLNTGWLSKTAVTHDGKLLFYNTIEENGDFDTYLFKLNQNLEQDTFYTTPFVYDSLCPYQIASDTIVPDDCGVIVGIEEDKETGGQGEEGKRGGLEIWPNPAKDIVRISYSNLQKVGQLASWQLDKSTIEIYDIFGREVRRIKVAEGQDEVIVNVESYPPGVYIAILKNGLNIVESRKFVVAR